MRGLRFVSIARYVPEKVVTNDDLSRIVDTNDEWIRTRTGIGERHFSEGETAVDLCVGAARLALERAGIAPEELAGCIVATCTPDHASPSNACLVQAALGLPENIPCYDISAGCTGFLYGLETVRGMLALEEKKKYALLIGCDQLSRVIDMTDRSTCVLFGDGAGAAVLALEDRLWHADLGSRGNAEVLWLNGPGPETTYIHMDGPGVYRFAVDALPSCARTLLDKSGLTLDDIDWIVPHQANRRIIETAAKRLHAPLEKFYQNMERYGNTSAASVPIALDEMVEQGLLKRGQKVLAVAFGAGLTWGGALFEW
ncbi:beta-ketoacyl-ACP synthase III [Pseudoflavonifractor sp. MCC625]|uniref:beta-ketoacyl-ACP synthase III n=1 Tax=Pseudoflavonifractor sp. MCC625 TaxID=2592647 RepID=UPI001C009CE6|nr:beta-ketoacyl-ACP synthase III [Pseudoflavonifractor sp. MCC625]MBT9685633.1 beta-ketoacyl-ACP synthase III [Pseudoflavonifractor sp. MCC625]